MLFVESVYWAGEADAGIFPLGNGKKNFF